MKKQILLAVSVLALLSTTSNAEFNANTEVREKELIKEYNKKVKPIYENLPNSYLKVNCTDIRDSKIFKNKICKNYYNYLLKHSHYFMDLQKNIETCMPTKDSVISKEEEFRYKVKCSLNIEDDFFTPLRIKCQFTSEMRLC